MERLIYGDLISLLEEWNIPVEKVTQRKFLYRKNKSESDEYDLIAYNGDAIVVVEVKTTLTLGKVDRFIRKLKNFKKEHREYSDKIIFGGVGFLEAEGDSIRYTEQQGLFAIRSPGGKSDASTIENDRETFTLKAF